MTDTPETQPGNHEALSGFSLELHIARLVEAGNLDEAESDLMEVMRDENRHTPKAEIVDTADYFIDELRVRDAIVFKHHPEQDQEPLAVMLTLDGLYSAPYAVPDDYEGEDSWPHWQHKKPADEKMKRVYLPKAAIVYERYQIEASETKHGNPDRRKIFFADKKGVEEDQNLKMKRIDTLWAESDEGPL